MLITSRFNLQFDKPLHQDFFKISPPGQAGHGSFESCTTYKLGGGLQNVANFLYVYPCLGRWSNLTNIFQMGWNHDLQVSLHFGTVSIAIIKWGWTLPQLSKSSAISNVRSNINMMRSVPSVFLYPYVHRRTPSYTPKHLEVISKTLLVQTNIWVYCQGHCSSSFCLPKHQCVSVYHHIINAPILSPYNPPGWDVLALRYGRGNVITNRTSCISASLGTCCVERHPGTRREFHINGWRLCIHGCQGPTGFGLKLLGVPPWGVEGRAASQSS